MGRDATMHAMDVLQGGSQWLAAVGAALAAPRLLAQQFMMRSLLNACTAR